MPETTTYLFDYKEVAEALIKKQGIHKGFWGIGIEFGFVAQNVRTPDGGFAPAAVIPVQKVGLNRWAEPNNLTVDASKVNPSPAAKTRRAGARRATAKVAKKK